MISQSEKQSERHNKMVRITSASDKRPARKQEREKYVGAMEERGGGNDLAAAASVNHLPIRPCLSSQTPLSGQYCT
jgi:hypothetical protein